MIFQRNNTLSIYFIPPAEDFSFFQSRCTDPLINTQANVCLVSNRGYARIPIGLGGLIPLEKSTHCGQIESSRACQRTRSEPNRISQGKNARAVEWSLSVGVCEEGRKTLTMSSGAFNKAVSLYAQLTADNRLKVWDVASGSSKQE
jgi:hypothetical protein